jgi:hypothetical protein
MQKHCMHPWGHSNPSYFHIPSTHACKLFKYIAGRIIIAGTPACVHGDKSLENKMRLTRLFAAATSGTSKCCRSRSSVMMTGAGQDPFPCASFLFTTECFLLQFRGVITLERPVLTHAPCEMNSHLGKMRKSSLRLAARSCAGEPIRNPLRSSASALISTSISRFSDKDLPDCA